jgi:hypothetical protein
MGAGAPPLAATSATHLYPTAGTVLLAGFFILDP